MQNLLVILSGLLFIVGLNSSFGDMICGLRSRIGDVRVGLRSRIGDVRVGLRSTGGDMIIGLRSTGGDMIIGLRSTGGDMIIGLRSTGGDMRIGLRSIDGDMIVHKVIAAPLASSTINSKYRFAVKYKIRQNGIVNQNYQQRWNSPSMKKNESALYCKVSAFLFYKNTYETNS